MAEGPYLKTSENNACEILLWMNAAGFLESVEIVDYGLSTDYTYDRFIDPANAPKLRYRYS